jgi:SAM-dependent methyltransferase
MADLFDTPDMIRGYAASRPAVHDKILARAKQFLPAVSERALDVGCGCGLSTRATLQVAKKSYGVERVRSMAPMAKTLLPGAVFVTGLAEALPFASNSVDLITAAGSLNYVRFDLFFDEAARVLSTEGFLLVYDFGQGKDCGTLPALSAWFASFEQRYPAPSGVGRVLDPSSLRQLCPGFRVVAEDSFVVAAAMSRRQYIDYLLTETNVSQAIRAGSNSTSIHSWFEESLRYIWAETDQGIHEILFPSYFVLMISDS